MTQSPITVTYDITELLQQINGKIDKLSDKVTAIEIGQAEIKGEIKNLTTEVTTIKADITELKGSQNKQVWTLIGLIAGAVLSGIVIAIWRTALIGKV